MAVILQYRGRQETVEVNPIQSSVTPVSRNDDKNSTHGAWSADLHFFVRSFKFLPATDNLTYHLEFELSDSASPCLPGIKLRAHCALWTTTEQSIFIILPKKSPR